MKPLPYRALLLVLVSVTGPVTPAAADTCNVPDGTYPTIQSAVDDPVCTDIQLAAQTYPESVVVPRSLTIQGVGSSSVVGGFMRAHGAGVIVIANALRVEASCARGSLQSWTGGELVAVDVEAVSSINFDCPGSPIFTDGFESGDTSAWSSTVP